MANMRIVVITALISVSFLPGKVFSEPERRTVSVNSHSEVRATPNLAIVSFAIVTEAKKAAEAAAENAKRASAVSAALKGSVGAEGKVTTAGYSVQPKYAYDGSSTTRNAPHIDGYSVTNQVSVETAQIDSVGTLVDQGLGAGANQVGSVTFTLSERSAALREALTKAGAEARVQAESVAQALGVRLKGVVSASTQGSLRPQPRMFNLARAATAEASVTTPIEAGDVTVSADLTVTYEIE